SEVDDARREDRVGGVPGRVDDPLTAVRILEVLRHHAHRISIDDVEAGRVEVVAGVELMELPAGRFRRISAQVFDQVEEAGRLAVVLRGRRQAAPSDPELEGTVSVHIPVGDAAPTRTFDDVDDQFSRSDGEHILILRVAQDGQVARIEVRIEDLNGSVPVDIDGVASEQTGVVFRGRLQEGILRGFVRYDVRIGTRDDT